MSPGISLVSENCHNRFASIVSNYKSLPVGLATAIVAKYTEDSLLSSIMVWRARKRPVFAAKCEDRSEFVKVLLLLVCSAKKGLFLVLVDLGPL